MPFTISSEKRPKKTHKKEKLKKHKKEKKSKKHKKKSRRKTYSSDSSTSSSEEELKIKNQIKQDAPSNLDFFDTVLSDSNLTLKSKKVKKSSATPEKPGQNSRELNPYWKDGGCGLPPDFSEKEARELEATTSSGSSNLSGFYNKGTNIFDIKTDNNRKSNLKFLKPGEVTCVETYKNSYQGNWKKKGNKFEHSENLKVKSELIEVNKNEAEEGTLKSYTNNDLNSLAAKLVKAEILGNTAQINKLKAELAGAKKIRDHNESQEKNNKEIIIVTNTNLKRTLEENSSQRPSRRQKVNTHDSKERTCYFPDDDKYSLKNLFEKEKTGSKDDDLLLLSKLNEKKSEDIDDAYVEAAASQKYLQKSEERKSQKSLKEALVKHKTLKDCCWCLDNRSQTKHLIISTGNKCYLCLPEEESLSKGHCLIVPLQHEISTIHLDEDIWDEIKNYKKALTEMFLEQEKDVIFFESAKCFKQFPHCYIQCVPLNKEIGDLAPIYFQKAISESETEWSNNKKVIDFRHKDLRRSIPKGLPYFAVFFGREGGFAHVIEDEHLFQKNFAQEVLGGMMDLDPKRWRKPQKENFKAQREKALDFLKIWKKFEFNENLTDSDSSSISD